MSNKKCNQSHSTTVTSQGMSKYLGQGAFGKVFKERIGGVTCAVKRIKNYDELAMKEVVTLMQLNCYYIIKLRGFFMADSDRQLSIIMEFADRNLGRLRKSRGVEDSHGVLQGAQHMERTPSPSPGFELPS